MNTRSQGSCRALRQQNNYKRYSATKISTAKVDKVSRARIMDERSAQIVGVYI